MKTNLTRLLALGIACWLGRACAAEHFFLVNVPSETILGPYTYVTGARLSSSADPWHISVINDQQFNLTNPIGQTNGPFAFADRSTVTVAGVSLILSTNLRLMVEMRDRQKQWLEHPETNPRVLSTIRGSPANGYEFVRSEPDAVVVRQPTGIARINLNLLPEDIQRQFSYDPAAAAAYSKERADALAAWQQQQTEQNAARIAALEKFWATAKPPEVVQPEFPEPYFKTKGFGSSSPAATISRNTGNNNNNNSRNNNGSRTITIGGNKKD